MPDTNGSNGTKRKHVDYPAPKSDIKWEEIGFGLTTRETTMVVAKYEKGKWGPLEAQPYGKIPIEPASTVLNYGQGIFEGVKAHRTSKGRIVIFRPKANAARFDDSARQFLMPTIPEEFFLDAVGKCVRENAHWVPPSGTGSLYLRPLLLGTGPDLGVQPSTEYLFVCYCAPVGQYFKGGGAKLKIIHEQHRAAPGGVGHIKCCGNYAPCFEAQRDARAEGFSDVLYLDSRCEYIEEAAASNFFCLSQDGLLFTPELGSILPGVTRNSILQLARLLIKEGKAEELGLRSVREGQVSVSTVLSAKEAFLTGTGAGIVPVTKIQPGTRTSRSTEYAPGTLADHFAKMLKDIQLENAPDAFGWLYDPFDPSA
eukprot:TRINITY_DN100002_c0_g1_i1.p1 TRINITY_DN100002_c0_g1~~TRINITY_DN100002_c0_g1_i1.p1  ORF type:complete len:369 (-),score=56.93 TRINITY_DN100002_c0_g1_i1:21-1127(-)